MSIGKVVPVLTIFTVLFLLLGIGVWGQPSMSVDMATGRITIRASRKQIDEVEKAKAEFPLETRQIQVKARLLRLSESATREFGINLELLTGVKVPLGEAGEGTGLELAGGVLEYTFYNLTPGKEKLEAILDALISTGEAEVLSAPQVSTLSGQVAGMYVVQDVPYLISEEVKRTVTTELGIVEEITPAKWGYQTVGIILQVLPDIVGGDLVQMSIVPMVARYEIRDEFGKEHPVFSREIAPTNITVRSGETIVIGGLMREEETESVAGLPILSQLPVIGSLFKKSKKVTSKTNLVVTVEPRIITPREIQGRSKRIFTFTYALAEDMARQIGEMVSPQGVIEINPKEAPPNSILVRDDEDRVKVIEEVLNGIGSFVEQRRQRRFSLQFSSAQPTKEILESLISEKGSIEIEEENSLLVEDGAYQLWQIEKAIFSLEKSNEIPQTKIFSLEYVQASSIVSSLEELLSPQFSSAQPTKEILEPLLSTKGSIEIEEGNSLLVEDGAYQLSQIEKAILSLEESNEIPQTKTFSLKYVQASSIAPSLEEFLSPQGSIEIVDNKLIVVDNNWAIEQIRKRIEEIDISGNSS